MYDFTYCIPTEVVFGKDTVSTIGGHVAKNGVKHVLLVAGGGSIKKNGVYETVVASLNEAGVAVTEFWGVKPNPSLDQVEAGAALAKEHNVDGVLAVGGGSVMDCSKAIAAAVYLDDYWAHVLSRKLVEKALPVFTVCTLSGTGSELNQRGIITNEETAQKWSIVGLPLVPKVSVIDPTVQYSLPWQHTASSGIDAMTHVMENYFRGTVSNAETELFHQETTLQIDEGMMRSIGKCLDQLQQNPEDYGARGSLAWAAAWSFNGFSQAGLADGDWCSHALEHAVSGMFPHVPHGEGLAVIMPSWMEQIHDRAPEIFTRYAKEVWGEDTAMGGVRATREAFNRWGAPSTLSQWGVTEEHLPQLVKLARDYRDLGKVVPVSDEEAIQILRRVL